MSLSRKIFLKAVGLLLGLLVLTGAALWGLHGLRGQVESALDEYKEVRDVEGIALHLAAARTAVESPNANLTGTASALRSVIDDLKRFAAAQELDEDDGPGNDNRREQQIADAASRKLTALLMAVNAAGALPADSLDRPSALATVDSVSEDLKTITKICYDFIRTTQEAANLRLHRTERAIAGLSGLILIAAILLSVSQYRGVVRPLRRLRKGVRRVAAGRFTTRLEPLGDREFVELAAEFNDMAAELDDLYHSLEEKVAVKSKELIRSERLASVGFLAAGVAHEINNPLNIISGYAELSLKKLCQCPATDGGDGAGAGADCPSADARRNMQIIRDEAFRCKEITEKLLSLARCKEDKQEMMSLAGVASEMATMMSGLKNYRGRRLLLRFDESDPLSVYGNVTEMKQVMLNMMVNAFEAVQPGEGEVNITGRRRNGWVELSVRDNGRGMPPETLERVFEPFFTEKRGAGAPGTGLGLSITHAIVEKHGGRIRAESEGPGRGSRFTIELPARDEAKPAGV